MRAWWAGCKFPGHGHRAAGFGVFIPEAFWPDKKFVQAVVERDGIQFQWASRSVNADKEVVLAAARNNGASLRFGVGGLSQDPDCLRASGLWYATVQNCATVTLSVKMVGTKFCVLSACSAFS